MRLTSKVDPSVYGDHGSRFKYVNVNGSINGPADCINKLGEYEDFEEDGRLKVLPCKIGDPLYFIADEDDVGNETPTVKEIPGGVSAIIITASGIRVSDSVELAQILEYSNEIGTRYAYLSPEDAAAAVKGVDE